MMNLADNQEKNNIKIIAKGSLVSIIITIVALMIFAIILSSTGVPETAIPTVIIIITAVSILIGSSLSMTKIKKNGIVNGALIGLIYIVFIYLLSSIVERDFSMSIYSIIMIVGSILAGAIGGIIGINKR
jgi:putative membrane protein (TIGR04086 family)